MTLLKKSFILLVALCNLAFCEEKKEIKPTYRIVVSFSILKDLVKNIIGKDIKKKEILVEMIVPLMNDPHIYQLKPKDIIKLQKANLIIMNGVGLEEWMERIVTQKRYTGKYIKLANFLKARYLDKKLYDPHLWNDVSNIIEYVKKITIKLSSVIPEHKSIFEKNAHIYINELKKLDNFILNLFRDIPQEKRFIVTTHDAFWYFGKKYNLTFLSPIGVNTEEEPKPQKICELIRFIKNKNIKAVFIENLSNPNLIKKIVNEAKINLGGELYADSLSPKNKPASSYIDMMKYNAKTMHKELN